MLAFIKQIQQRLVAILGELVTQFPRQGAYQGIDDKRRGWWKVPKMPLEQAIFLSKHVPVFGFRSVLCAKCGEYASGTHTALLQWLFAGCSGNDYSQMLGRSRTQPMPVPMNLSVRIAGRVLHCSHRLRVYRHLYYCTECGKIAGIRVQQLADPCKPLGVSDLSGRQVPAGTRNLRRLAQGELPFGSPFWPDQIPLQWRGHTITL